MGGSHELYDRLSQKLMVVCADQVTNVKQIVNLIWLVVGVINARSIALSEMANSVPGACRVRWRPSRG